MRRIFLSILTMLLFLTGFAQSETNDMITYDTVFATRPASHRFVVRITRPRNMFTPGSPDMNPRPAFITMNGAGEMNLGDAGVNDTNTIKSRLTSNGPHMYLANGTWDGSVQTGNGTHYPIIITIGCNKIPNVGDSYLGYIMDYLLTRYRIKSGSVHVAGFSAGGWVWGRYITLSEANMAKVKSFLSLMGAGVCPDDGTSACGTGGLGIPGFGRWAKQYDGRFAGFEGTADTRNLWQVRNSMDDSIANRAYFTYENYGSGGHCCWNTIYNPALSDWRCTSPITNPNIQTNGLSGRHNSMGTYIPGNNIVQWMIKQGDTTLVSGGSLPVANGGTTPLIITLPTSQATLDGSASTNAVNYLWARVSGPNTPGLQNANTSIATIGATGTALVAGTYVYRLTVTDGSDENPSTYDVTVQVNNPANIPPTSDAGANRSFSLPQDSVHMAGAIADPDGVATALWTQVDGPNTAVITDATDVETSITGLIAGTYVFQLTATDDDFVSVSDQVTVTVVPLDGPPRLLNVNIMSTVPYVNGQWNNWNITAGALFNMAYSDGAPSTIDAALSVTGTMGDNGVGYTGNTIAPNEVQRFFTTVTVARTLTISGLDDSKRYNFILYSSRIDAGGVNNFQTKFTIGPGSLTIVSSNNKDNAAVFNNLTSLNGIIVISMIRGEAAGTNSNIINGFTIQEVGVDVTNNPPIVTPIDNQSIQLPTSTGNLSASVQDENLPAVTYQWSQLSGPTTGTITSSTSLTTTVTGLTVVGTYVFQLAAEDEGGLEGIGQITIIVNPAGNILPVANAGSDQTLVLPTSSAVLNGTSTDADGTVVIRLWEKVSGPVQFTISNPNIANPTLSNLVAGTYVFRYTVTDNLAGVGSDEMSIVVSASFVVAQKLYMGPGEYVWGGIDSLGHGYEVGTLDPPGEVGRIQRLNITPYDLRFRYVAGSLNGVSYIDENGYAWIAGYNGNGEHGVGDSIDRTNPSQILIDSVGNDFVGMKSITGYHYRATSPTEDITGWLGIKEDGSLWVWGNVQYGYRGDGSIRNNNAPRPVRIVIPGNRQVRQVAATITVIILCTDGTVWTYGGGASAANLGRPITGTDYAQPIQLTGLSDIVQVAGGRTFNYALRSDGVLYSWGSWGEYQGRTGAGAGNPVTVPTAAPSITSALPAPISKIVTSYFDTHVLLTDGSLWGWGGSPMGNVGNGVFIDPLGGTDLFSRGAALVPLPVRIAPNVKFIDINSNGCYTMYQNAIDENGNAYFWGRFKGGVSGMGAKFATTQVGSTYGNDFDQAYPTLIYPFTVPTQPTIWSVQARYCIANPGSGVCNTPPASTAPVANAGSNQTITTNNALLNGTASTDAIKILQYRWSQVSGPSTATINLPGSPTPRAYFTTDGVFVFKLVVQNGGRKLDSTTVQITVGQIPNVPPVTFAGNNQAFVLPQTSTTLSGTATDADGTIAGTLWTQVSGTAVTITSPLALATTVTGMTTAGTYVFNLRSTDNLGATSDSQVTVVVGLAEVTLPRKYIKLR